MDKGKFSHIFRIWSWETEEINVSFNAERTKDIEKRGKAKNGAGATGRGR